MAGYFADVDLERVRLVEQDPLPIAGLPFQGALRACGFDFPDPRLVTAITFDGVIAARHPLSDAVLFHELVHVVQFRLLGVREFSRQYVDGFLKSGSYEGISLEICAYGLEARFDLAARPFAVEDEVRIKFADRERG